MAGAEGRGRVGIIIETRRVIYHENSVENNLENNLEETSVG
jgi:hypothetical protein